jgi:hypothetical protein
MKPIHLTLQDDVDAALLPVFAKFWKINIAGLSREAQITALRDTMLDPARAEAAWDMLNDQQRGAMQMLIGSGGKMPMAKFGRLFGEPRQMGAAQIERENPLQNPQNVAEGLYYRGLIAQTFEQADTGPRVVVYVPEELARALPLRKTSYPDLQPSAEAMAQAQSQIETDPLVEPLNASQVRDVRQADTSIVDDLATLLAYLQLRPPTVEGESLVQADRAQLMRHLLKAEDDRLTFLFALSQSADLVELQAGKAYPKRAETRRWLSAPRYEQVQLLAESWRTSKLYRDLWHVPGLHPDPGGELDEYDAAVARASIIEVMGELLPKQEWWSLEAFIAAVKDSEPDFQRPGGDYQSWYIRNDQGDYLTGFENWDAIEGGLLEFYVTGPMHWLGLIDRAEDAARLTAYGRAFLGQANWPTPPEPEDKISVKDDGTLLVSRKVTRVDRFQVARFASWISPGDPFTYKLDAAGIQQAAEQGISTEHIASFISRASGGAPVPAGITRLLDNWKTGPAAAVTLEQLTVLRTNAPETLDKIYDTPALRRYLGARLGPMAVIVRAGQWEALRAALGEQGIQAEVVE